MTTEQGVFNIMDALTSPILTHARMWADCLPDRLLKLVRMERMVQLMLKKEEAGDAETVAFIMTRTFEAPMEHDWVEIYTHLALRVCQQHWPISEEAMKDIRAPEVLTDYQQNYLLGPLRRWIYERRRQHTKTRGRSVEVSEKKQKAINGKPALALDLFSEVEEVRDDINIFDDLVRRARETHLRTEKHKLWQQASAIPK